MFSSYLAAAFCATFLLDHEHTMRVAAVIQDLPSNTHFKIDMVGSARAEFSPAAIMDRAPANTPKPWGANTYFRLDTGRTLASVHAALDQFLNEHRPPPAKRNGMKNFLPVMPIGAIHLVPTGAAAMRDHGSIEMLYTIGGVGLLILIVSIINFVNLSTARAARRRVEVAVRKAVGATRGQLIVQFIGENSLYAALGALLAVCVVELVLPEFNRLSGTDFTFDYWHHPQLLLWAGGLTLFVGLLAGAYFALVLGSINPVSALKGGPVQAGGVLRGVLVTTQFTVLIGLLCTIIVVFEQTSLAKDQLRRLDTRGVFVIETDCEQLSVVFGACCGVALLLACTGLFGLTSFAAERRTKETGIRKAMGAGRSDILRLLFGQLTLPVLEANLIAWPVCFFLLRHWLAGFAYHVDLGAEVFLGAGLAAVLVAWLTICGQVLRLAALRPVTSLRYE